MVYNLFDDEKPESERSSESPVEDPAEMGFITLPFDPPSTDESVRRSGLAWSAGIVFFGSTAFMLGLGWIADLILGISPWGIVAGIILGAIIGFIQFFRITSQIFGNKHRSDEIRPLLSRQDDDDR
ncbi:MAG: AtpZ/AtpI family protein [Acidobacteriota bacterium]